MNTIENKPPKTQDLADGLPSGGGDVDVAFSHKDAQFNVYEIKTDFDTDTSFLESIEPLQELIGTKSHQFERKSSKSFILKIKLS